jgi:hypothetical protein
VTPIGGSEQDIVAQQGRSSAGPTVPEADASPEEQALARLAALGSETHTERTVKRVLPWVVSVVLHAGLIVLGLLLTWTVVLLRADEEPVLVVADFDAMTYDPLTMLDLEQAETVETPTQDRLEHESFELTELDDAIELELDPVTFISDAASPSPLADYAPETSRATAEFVGLSTTNARRIVYVIDASGSMIPYLRRIVQELSRSLDGLSPDQAFGIVFFQGSDVISVPPADELAAATEAAKVRALEWIDRNVIAHGGTSPPPAIARALALDPDVIFLLSQDIRGYGEFEVDQQELLEMLDRLNPVDERTGRRRTLINCIQFAYQDELQTMRRIAEQHGGPRGYKFLDREELGL